MTKESIISDNRLNELGKKVNDLDKWLYEPDGGIFTDLENAIAVLAKEEKRILEDYYYNDLNKLEISRRYETDEKTTAFEKVHKILQSVVEDLSEYIGRPEGTTENLLKIRGAFHKFKATVETVHLV